MKKNFNIINNDEIIEKLSAKLPHIQKNKIKLVYHLLQREMKISLVEGKTISIGNFFSFRIALGRVKKFWCVFKKKISNTIINSKIETTSGMKRTAEIKKFISKGKVIEHVETRGLRVNQKYAYKTAQRADAKAKEGQKLG